MLIIKIIPRITILDDNGQDINRLFCAFHLKIANETTDIEQYKETTTRHYTDDVYLLGKYDIDTGFIYSTHEYNYDLNNKKINVENVKILDTSKIAKYEIQNKYEVR